MIIYFSYHALSGDQSVLKWVAYRQAEADLRVELSLLQTRQDQLDRQNSLLRNGSLDLDYLDERARAKLRFVHPRDRVILFSAS